MKDERDIDKLFRRGLTDPVNETGFKEADWDNLEQLLDGDKKRRGVVYWLPLISSVAAMLLLILGWWLFKPQQTDNGQKPKQMAIVKQPVSTQNYTEPADGNATVSTKAPVNAPSAGTIAQTKISAGKPVTGKRDIYAGNIIAQKTMASSNAITSKSIANNHVNNAMLPNANAGVENYNSISPLVAYNTTAINTTKGAANELANPGTPTTHEIDNTAYVKLLAAQRNKEDVTIKSGFKHPQFALTVMGAPELNGVNSFQSGKTGVNAGLMFSVNMNKLTISTGVGYAKKPYNTSFENYHSTGYTFKTFPTDVVADCRAIDIPLNIDYQVFNKHQNKISVGTGISSYLMMHENYQYDYADPAAKGPRSYTIPSPGRYLFGVLNFQATYQRQINSKIGVNVQPYLKLPLTNIGASQVKLQSAGVALGISWNINSLTKP